MQRAGFLLLGLVLAGCAGPAASPGGVVMAAPAARHGDGCGMAQLGDTVLRQVNAARAAGQVCGGQAMAPAGALVWHPALAAAASRHSGDMAARDYFDHGSPEGERVRHRVVQQGYAWRAVGENLAGGDTTVRGVIAGWLASETHCRNMMNPEFSEAGVACVRRSGTTWGAYWTLVMATRR
jgi:uncharacterized protein YkwD